MRYPTMQKPDNARKSRFRAALALAGLTAAAWAEQNGVTAGHLSQVLAGKHTSRALNEKIDAFTKKYMRAA